MYKQQLKNSLKCSDIKIDNIKKLNYKQSLLTNIFSRYNRCVGSNFIDYEKKIKRKLFHINIRAGLNSSSLSINSSEQTTRNIDFDNEIGIRLGVEVEFILPFNKNKWTIIAEPTFQSYQSDKGDTKADYKSIELPIGLRHYLFLNENSKIFVNGALIFDFNLDSKIDFSSGRQDLDISSQGNFGFGLGYTHNNKYSIELRYQTSRKVLGNYIYWSSSYKTVSIIFGYSLF